MLPSFFGLSRQEAKEVAAELDPAKVAPRRTVVSNDEEVLKLALGALIETQGERKASVPPGVKREVVARDEAMCRWKLPDGGVRGATVRLEIDHVVPRGKGGPSTADDWRGAVQGARPGDGAEGVRR